MAIPVVEIDVFIEDARRCIWHAFSALSNKDYDEVAKSKLKVLTNTIGQAFGEYKAERILEDELDDKLPFNKYFHIISSKLFDTNNNGQALTHSALSNISDTCWMLFESHCVNQRAFSKMLTQFFGDDLYLMWQLFNFLVKVDLKVDLSAIDNVHCKAILPLRVDVEETYRLASSHRIMVGFDATPIPQINPTAEDSVDEFKRFSVDFVEFLVIIAKQLTGLSSEVLHQGLKNLYYSIYYDIIKKGYMDKYGNQVTNWKHRWFCLTSKQLRYYTNSNETDKKGAVDVSDMIDAQNLPQKAGQKSFRLKLITSHKNYELATTDMRMKNEWLAAFQKVTEFVGRSDNYHRYKLIEREKARSVRREKIHSDISQQLRMKSKIENQNALLELEYKGRQEDRSLLQLKEKQLEEERQTRIGVETQLAEEEASLEEERHKLRELEEIRFVLEKLLLDERQAMHDGEVARSLQSELLASEMSKREELEMLRAHQEQLLHSERQQKEGLELEHLQQETLLGVTQRQLQDMCRERENGEVKIREAEEKITKAECERRKMEERYRLRQMCTSVGLQQPVGVTVPGSFVSHRGKGAFVSCDIMKKCSEDLLPGPQSQQ